MSITLDRAAEYFKKHVSRDLWNEYSADQKERAILQARRDLSRALGRAIRDDEPPYREGDRTRDEFAVYEQAIYTLLREENPRGVAESPVPSLNQTEVPAPGRSRMSGYGKYAPEALSWLAKRITNEIVLV